MIQDIILKDRRPSHLKKPVIFSVTGTAEETRIYRSKLCQLQAQTQTRVLMEINLSCPNITGKEPAAYSRESLTQYLKALQQPNIDQSIVGTVEIGIKLPPYTHKTQFDTLIDALLSVTSCPLTFITSTNTLGSCLVLSDDLCPAVNSESGHGIGGLAGDALHPLALGNVKTIRVMLDMHVSLKGICIIGIGGVSDGASFRRMRAVGADVVAVGTALGRYGIEIFSRIIEGASKLEENSCESPVSQKVSPYRSNL